MGLAFYFWEDDWMRRKYGHLEAVKSRKYCTFKAALNLFLQNNGEIIVETGTQRLRDDPGGCSTLLFGAFCKAYNKTLYTVDNNPKHLEISRQLTEEFKDHIVYVLSDSVEFLRKFDKPIDLLYLDSLDCPPPPADATQSQLHQLKEIKAAYPKLHKGSVVLLDDNDFENGGKTRLSKRWLLRTGEFLLILDDKQSLWLKVR